MDLEFMEKLHKKVNIVPVIGKADVLTKTELEAFKNKVCLFRKKVDNNYLIKIMLMLKEYHISLYKFTDNTINDCLPLAMVGSNTFIENEKGQRVRVRKYPWGTVFIENKVSKGCF